ncbi:MAG: mechanosensitive ion channel family protein [Candidatus Cyclobacteriaceae bacterium M3_2C_046]
MFSDLQNEFDKVVDKLSNWLGQLIVMLPNLVVAILLLILFYFIGKGLRNVLTGTLKRVSDNYTINNFLGTLLFVSMVVVGLFFALGVLQLDRTVTSLLAGVGIAGLAIGLAFKDIAANFLAGIYLAIKSPINDGDLIEYDEHYGTVKKIGLRALTMQTLQGQDIVIPNRFIMENAFIHYTINGVRRVDLAVGISYGDDLEKVQKVTLETINKLEHLKGKPVDFYYTEFGSSSINFVVRYWVNFNKETDYLQAMSQGIIQVKKAFDQNDITITFPIRTLDFGIKGGEKLSEMLVNAHKETQQNGSSS